MTRTSSAARLTFAALVGASFLLAACGDDGDGGDAAGGSGSGSPLSSLLSGFGTPGAGNPTGPAPDGGMAAGGGGGTNGAGGAESGRDAGAVTPETPATPATPVSENCSRVCQRVVECMPEGGCPNFDRLSQDVQNQTVADCESKCGDITDAYYDVIRRLSCQQVAAQLMEDPDVAAFCALTPASDEDCDRFCDQLDECGVAITRDQCGVACLYSPGGVACVIENGCEADACTAFFPEEG